MKIIIRSLFLIIIFTNQNSFANNSKNFIAVKINNKAITNSEIEDRYDFVLKVSGMSFKNSVDKKILRSQIVDKMIDEELVRQESSRLKIDINKDEMKEALMMISKQRKQNIEQFKSFFTKNNLSFENYEKQIESEILWSKIISELLKSKVKITDFEVREFFEQGKFNTNVRKFLLAEILISSSKNSAQLAQKITHELRHGADFNNIVRQFSSGFSSETNGEIGWVSQSEIEKKIYEAISKLEKGDYSDPVLLADGHHIFKLIDTGVEAKIHDKDLNIAKNIIFNRKLQNLAKSYLADLRKKSFVELNQNL